VFVIILLRGGCLGTQHHLRLLKYNRFTVFGIYACVYDRGGGSPCVSPVARCAAVFCAGAQNIFIRAKLQIFVPSGTMDYPLYTMRVVAPLGTGVGTAGKGRYPCASPVARQVAATHESVVLQRHPAVASETLRFSSLSRGASLHYAVVWCCGAPLACVTFLCLWAAGIIYAAAI
jgi:hypothetical protein